MSCYNWMVNRGNEIDTRSLEMIKSYLIDKGVEGAAEKAAEYFELKTVEKLLPFFSWAEWAKLMKELWDIRDEEVAKYKHCEY